MTNDKIIKALNYWIDLSHCCCGVPNAIRGCLHCDLVVIRDFVSGKRVDDDDDFNDPLGVACQLGDTECESCQ